MLTMLLTTANLYEDAKRCVQFRKLVPAPACLIVCKVLLVYYVKGSFSVSVWWYISCERLGLLTNWTCASMS